MCFEIFTFTNQQACQGKNWKEGNADPTLKPEFYIFLLIFQHKWMFPLPFEGHNVAYQCKGLGQSNIVCEYEVNLSTNEKVITEKQNFNTNC